MRKKKEPLPPPTADELQTAAKQLSNTISLTILKYLFKSGFGLQSSIIKATGFSQPTVSKQLKALNGSGFITKESFRTCKIYGLNRERFHQLGINMDVWLCE